MSTTSRVVKNTTYLYIRMAVTLIVSLWTTRIILNALGVDNFGIYNVVGGVIALLGFLNGTLSSATQRYINFAEGQKDSLRQLIVFNNSFLLHLGLGIILLLCFGILGVICFNGLLDIPPEREFAAQVVYACMCMTALLSVMNVPYEASIVAHENLVFYAYIGIIEVIAKLAIAFIIMYSTVDRLILYAMLMTVVPLLTFVIMRIFCYRHYRECRVSLSKYYDRSTLRDLTSFAGWNFLSSSSGIITQYGLNVVINHFFGVVLNAAQGIASQVSGVLVNLSANAMKSLNPIIIKSESLHQRDRMLYVSLLGCRVSYFIFAAASIPLVYLMKPVLSLWLNSVPPWAVLFCQLQLIRITLEMLTNSLSTSIMAEGKIKYYNIARSTLNILPLIVVSVLFVFGFAPYWMYIVWILCWSILGGVVNLYFAHINVGLSYRQFLQIVFFPALISTMIPFIVLLLGSIFTSNVFVNIIIVFVAEIIFLILSWRYLYLQEERQKLSSIIFRFIPLHK